MRTTLLFCAAALMAVCVPARRGRSGDAGLRKVAVRVGVVRGRAVGVQRDSHQRAGRHRGHVQGALPARARSHARCRTSARARRHASADARAERRRVLSARRGPVPRSAQESAAGRGPAALYGRENGLREQEVRRGRCGVQAGIAGHRGNWRRRSDHDARRSEGTGERLRHACGRKDRGAGSAPACLAPAPAPAPAAAAAARLPR